MHNEPTLDLFLKRLITAPRARQTAAMESALQQEFPGIQGFSAQNLWRMRQFYLAYADSAKLSPLVREISWTKNVIILMQCKAPLEREFYIRMTRKFGWTKDVFAHQIDIMKE